MTTPKDPLETVPPPVPEGGDTHTTGQGADSALEAMLKKRRMRADPGADPLTQEQQPQPRKPA
ncbi:MAG: hypothetical protein HYX47_02520 [Burkholderiales bacterium]|nr:hypothetical protein [Burkholderiales bacterium]